MKLYIFLTLLPVIAAQLNSFEVYNLLSYSFDEDFDNTLINRQCKDSAQRSIGFTPGHHLIITKKDNKFTVRVAECQNPAAGLACLITYINPLCTATGVEIKSKESKRFLLNLLAGNRYTILTSRQ